MKINIEGRKLTLFVGPSHISRGTKKSSAFCPIALALLESGAYGVRVGEGLLQIWFPDHSMVIYDLPKIVRKFIYTFDYDTSLPQGFCCTLTPRRTE